MALLPNINVGTSPNDGTGDSIRDAFTIVNENFQFIEAFFPNSSVSNLVANITSTGTSTFEQIDANVINVQTLGNAGTLITGNIVTAAQPNITSLGNLTSLTVDGAATMLGSFSTASNHTVQGSFSIPPNELVSNVYTISSTDTVILGNVSATGNATVTLPNADISNGRTIEVRWWDPDNTNSLSIVSIDVESGAGNIFSDGTNQVTSIALSSVDFSVKLTSDGSYWFKQQQTSIAPGTGVAVRTLSAATSSITSSDYFVLANTSLLGNTTATLPNASVSSGQQVVVRLWDPDNSDPTANVTVNVEPGAANIWSTDRDQVTDFIIYGNTANVTAKFISDGTYWYVI